MGNESEAGLCLNFQHLKALLSHAWPDLLHKHTSFPTFFYGWACVPDGPVEIPKVTYEILGPQRICAHQPLRDS